MPARHQWQSRIKAAEREYVAMRQAADRFLDDAQRNPTVLLEDLRHGEIVMASRNLEATYIVRLFAEFETGARHYWGVAWGTEINTHDLFEALAARRRIPLAELANAHRARECRNGLVHEREDRPDSLEIALSRKFLCTFFSFLPVEW